MKRPQIQVDELPKLVFTEKSIYSEAFGEPSGLHSIYDNMYQLARTNTDIARISFNHYVMRLTTDLK